MKVRVRVDETVNRWGHAVVEVPDGTELINVPYMVKEGEINYDNVDWVEYSTPEINYVDQPDEVK